MISSTNHFMRSGPIMARVEELLRWCDTLEAQLHQTRTLGARLHAA
jgi:hypothetical protein